jgi:hypothetical protein
MGLWTSRLRRRAHLSSIRSPRRSVQSDICGKNVSSCEFAKDIAVISVFGSPLETAIQRDIQRLRVQYAHHPKLEECCNNLVNQQARIRIAIEPADL